jgi:DNA-binding transcriptional regulator LsrR (DeoR family)
MWCSHRIYRTVSEKASQADVTFIGVGTIEPGCPLHKDGFISGDDVALLMEKGAVAEVLGHFMDPDGNRISSDLNARLTSVGPKPHDDQPVIALAGGSGKHVAIRAALNGRWINGLVTDEVCAQALLG